MNEDSEEDEITEVTLSSTYKHNRNIWSKPECFNRAEGADVVMQQDRAGSPVPSGVSMKSDWSMNHPIQFKKDTTPDQCADVVMQQDRAGSPGPSCVSMKSDWSMDPPVKFEQKDTAPDQCVDVVMQQDRAGSPVPSGVSMKSDWSRDPPVKIEQKDTAPDQWVQSGGLGPYSEQKEQINFSATKKIFETRFMSFMAREMKRITQILSPDYSARVETSEDEEVGSDARESAVNIGLQILTDMKEQHLFEKLLKYKRIFTHQEKLKSSLKQKCACVFEGIAKQGNPSLLNKIYTELYITEGESGPLNDEHEVRQIESMQRGQMAQETPIKCNDIFKPLPGQDKRIRTVLTKGVAGIGKTVSVQKFILDWAEGKANKNVHFMFPLPFRELNLMSKEQYSLEDLLHCFFQDMKEFALSELENFKVVFIFDGLDECRLPLAFKRNKRCSDITKKTSLDILLTNLIMGNMLPSAQLWITSRPAAANQLPPNCIDQVTEVRGFNDPQKEQYFSKRIIDRSLANRIIKHLKSSRSLYIMCHIPVFCWISATVLERRLGDAEMHPAPKSLTEMYTHFLIYQTVQRNEKYMDRNDMQPCLTKENILALGKLAFQQLNKGNLIFYEEDLLDCGIDVQEASIYSGVCTQIFREELGLSQRKMYCFVHLSFQEFLAALFAHLCWAGANMPQDTSKNLPRLCLDSTLFDLHKSAVDLALSSQQGHLDLFLRFLIGLSLESNQNLLHDLLMERRSTVQDCQETAKYIKQKLGEKLRPESDINLFHCLYELNDQSLVLEIQSYLSSKTLSSKSLTRAQWSALVFVLLTSENKEEVFDLRKYVSSNEGFRWLKPVVKASKTVILSSCNLTGVICPLLAKDLNSMSCAITTLDLSYNHLQDKGVAELCQGLKSPQCRLKTLKLAFCGISKYGCSALASALRSNPAHLTELDLTYNRIGNKGLSEFLPLLPNSLITTLSLAGCVITTEGCVLLTSVISSKPCPLKNLDLSENSLGHLGAGVFPELLSNENCKIQSLRLAKCYITWKSCNMLRHSSTAKFWSLRSLDLSDNDLQDSGLKQLTCELDKPQCKIDTLRLSSCGFTEKGFLALVIALRKNPTCLRELDLSKNFPSNTVIQYLFGALQQPTCTLQTLCLENCGFNSEVCPSLSETLRLRHLSLRELSLSHNDLGDEGVRLLCNGIQNGCFTLKKLRLANCFLTDISCEILVSTMSLNPTDLELDLRFNSFSESAVNFLQSMPNMSFIL